MSGELKTLVFPDLEGNLRALHTENTGRKYFDGSSIEGFQPIEDSDLAFEPLEDIEPRELFGRDLYMCGIYTPERERYEKDPRKILEDTLEELEEKGYSAKVGVEPEFFLLDEDGDAIDDAEYFDLTVSEIIAEAREEMKEADIAVQGYHSEVAGSQWEKKTDFTDKSPLEVADETLLYKKIVREKAAEKGLKASFDPKPFESENGSGMHMHFSLWKEGENLFSGGRYEDDSKRENISKEAEYFIGGILEHADALSAVVSATESSYNRIVPGKEAPTKKVAGHRNRSCLVRIPAFDSEGSARIEYRAPDPSCNPYLALSTALKAGMHGIEEEIEPEMMEEYGNENENAYEAEEVEELPGSLSEALGYLEEDEVVRDALGEAFASYLELKRDKE
ncbi:MAG: glutamine synthetase family protein [Candidatus Nanohaloarchaea archaeon]|nr:glutamine synthetase family protein [Candidatus Nanohaloarchaea archaeon]